MPVTVSYPGVYVEEIPSTSRTVTTVSTSATAFVDFFSQGPMNQPVKLESMSDFTRVFGGLDARSEASYGIFQFFNNGGQTAWAVRVTSADDPAMAAQALVEVKQPSAYELQEDAQDAASKAKDAAAKAWAAVMQVPPPSSPPFASPPPASPPDAPPLENSPLASPPSDPIEALNQAAAAALAVVAPTQEAAAQTQQAALWARATATRVATDEARADPTAYQDTVDEAEQAAIEAVEAANQAQAAAQAACEAAVADPLSSPPAGSPPSCSPPAGKTVDDLILAAREAAAKADKAAAKAALAAQAAQFAGEEAEELAAGPELAVTAANPGKWGNCVRIWIQNLPGDAEQPKFNLFAQKVQTVQGRPRVVANESWLNLSLDPHSASFAPETVNGNSNLVRVSFPGSQYVPGTMVEGSTEPPATTAFGYTSLTGGADGALPGASDVVPPDGVGGLYALDKMAPDVFNILCLPIVASFSGGAQSSAISSALEYCEERRAFYIVDIPPSVDTPDKMTSWSQAFRNSQGFSGATYFPRLVMPDPLKAYRPKNVGASGTLAGVYARTDTTRGVWKAPAGVEAVLQGAQVAVPVNDAQNGDLNPLGINVLRSFPIYGNIAWGARTLAGADLLQSQFKYVNVRRLTDFIEESLVQSLKWVVFEPNDVATWTQIRVQVSSFLAGLFAQGAFGGTTPDDSYFVRVDASTTTPDDIARGIVNIVVGIAPALPAEFVILQIEQITAQAAS